ncbi:repressor [Sulfolobus acidocaldarius SUSAZ]|nr:repressor [Sulfolobus acidocaldarius SUSAZ]
MKFQTLFFTIYGDYIINYGNSITVRSLIKIMREFGFTEGAIRAGLFRLRQKGLVDMIDRRRCSLSEAGLYRLQEGMKRVYERRNGEWDGKWRIVVYNIPESNRSVRDEMRKTLKWLGFGYLAQSTWISPNPVEESLTKFINELKDNRTNVDIFFFISDFVGNPLEMVRKCWDLKEVEEKYKEFVNQWNKVMENISSLKPNEAFITRIKLVHEYRKFLHIDPNLPKDLLPPNWIGYEAYELFQKLRNKLSTLSDQFFKSVYEP